MATNPAPHIPDHELLRQIGRGSYGEVWLARSITGAYRAVKIIYRDSFDHERPYEREFAGIKKFEPVSRESETQVDILHVGRNDAEGLFYYVMELADDQKAGSQINPDDYTARTLRSELYQRGRLPARECISIGIQLTTALEHLHGSGLIHRDIKPSNIVFVDGTPKLADVGLVTTLDATRSFVGTEGYIPVDGPGTTQADLYSLGKVLYEISTGRDRLDFPELPTDLKDHPERDELVQLNEVILKACDEDPKQRYQCADEMRSDLQRLKAGKPLARKKPVSRWKLLVGIVGTGILIGVLIIELNQFQSTQPPHAQGKLIVPQPAQIPHSGMALIPAGSFTMGDTLDGGRSDIPISVTVSAFYMDTNLISYSQWQSVYNWATSHGYDFVNDGAGKATNHPVQTVDWYDCVKWCNARSQQAGLTPVYYTDTGLTQIYTNGEVSPFVNWKANGYRLPTEAEWEKAARGGLNNQRFPWGNTISWNEANCFGGTNSNSYYFGPAGWNPAFTAGGAPFTSPVGYFAPNGYGLCDMAGNVLEWCWDWYGTPYAGGTDPHGPQPRDDRVLRGGSWRNTFAERCAWRASENPGTASNGVGFRCVRGF
jgi:formylglycine-generating enzyme required for sulfatase activity